MISRGISLKDIDSLTAFKRNTTGYVKRIKQSGKPLVMTFNGKAEIVVQDAASSILFVECGVSYALMEAYDC